MSNIACYTNQTQWSRQDVADKIVSRVLSLIPHVPTDKQTKLKSILSACSNKNSEFITQVDEILSTLTKWEFLYTDYDFSEHKKKNTYCYEL